MESISYEEFIQDARIATLEAAIELLWNEVAYIKGALEDVRDFTRDSHQHHCACEQDN
jgi:hypothetical protein